MKKNHIVSFMVLVCLALMPAGTYALPISGTGVNGGSFIGSLDVVYGSDSLSASAPWLIISLTNTSATGSRDIGLYIMGYVLANSAMTEIGPLGVGQTWTGRQPLATTDRGITAESLISGFVAYFRDAGGNVIDKAPVAVAEPSTMILFGLGLLAVGFGLRKRS